MKSRCACIRSIVEGQARTIDELKARRAKDLERLTEVVQSRDLLEARLAAQATKISEALEKLAEKDKLLSELDQRVGGARLLGSSDGDPARLRALSWKNRPREYWWWRQTVRAARKARGAGKLMEAQIFFDAALVVRETGPLWTELAHILRERSLFESAEGAYDRALEFDAKNAENIFLAGFCAEMSGHKTQAARRYEEALAKDPALVSRYEHLRDFNARLFG